MMQDAKQLIYCKSSAQSGRAILTNGPIKWEWSVAVDSFAIIIIVIIFIFTAIIIFFNIMFPSALPCAESETVKL